MLTFSSLLKVASDIHRFQHCTWLRLISCWKICAYQSHPQGYLKNSNVALLSLIALIQNIIVQYYFGANCIGYLFMLQNIFSYIKIFSHRHP